MAEVYKTLNNLESEIADKRKLKNKSNSKKEAVKTYHKNEQTKVDKRIMTKRANNGNNSTSINKKDRYADLNQVIDNYLIKLSKSLKEIFGDFDDVFMQKSSEPKHLKNADKMASYMKIDKLTTYPFEEGYAPTQKDHEVMNPLMKRREKKNPDNSFYIRGHLLNDNIGGIGEWKNMTPLTRAANKDHEKNVESVLKKGVEEGRVYSYKVVPTYKDNTVPLKRSEGETDESFKTKKAIVKAESKIASKLDTEYTELRGKAGTKGDGIKHTYEVINKITPNKESKDYTLESDTGSVPKPDTRISLGSTKKYDSSEVARVLGIKRKLAELILEHRTYTNGINLKAKILREMTKSTVFNKKDIEKWEKMDGTIKLWYKDNEGKGKIKYT